MSPILTFAAKREAGEPEGEDRRGWERRERRGLSARERGKEAAALEGPPGGRGGRRERRAARRRAERRPREPERSPWPTGARGGASVAADAVFRPLRRPSRPGGEQWSLAPPAGLRAPRPPRARRSPGRWGPAHRAPSRGAQEPSPGVAAPADPSPAGKGGGRRHAWSPARGPWLGSLASGSGGRRGDSRRVRAAGTCVAGSPAGVPGRSGGRGEEAGGRCVAAG